jgi:hypothetical protein
VLIAVPALAICGPGIVAAAGAGSARSAWAILAREVGPSGASVVSSPLRTLLTLDTAPSNGRWYASPGVVAAIALVVCGCALLALLSGRAAGAVQVGWLVAALALAAAFAAQRVTVTWPDGSGSQAANGWSGPGLSLALVGLLAAATASSSGVWYSGGFQHVRRVGAVIIVTAAAAGVLASATAWAWPGRAAAGDVEGIDVDVLPLVAQLEQEPPSSRRVLTLTDIEGGVAYSVENADGAVALTGSAAFGPDGAPLSRPDSAALPSPADLATAVATLVGSGVGADAELADWGIGVIVATPGSTVALAGLAQVDSLTLMGASELGTAYRVLRDGQPVSRAWIATDSEAVPVAMNGAEGGQQLTATQAGTLVLAVPSDESWIATLDGKELTRADDTEGRQAFAVPPGGGLLEVRFADGPYRAWWWAAAIACGLALIASAPIHDRRILGVRA